MKKRILALVAAVCSVALATHAQEQEKTEESLPPPQERVTKAPWPVWLQFNSTENLDIVGVRFNIPYGVCDEVTGLDIGFFGRTRNLYGIQANILRNDASDALAGVQIGIWNSAGRTEPVSVQCGLWNEAGSFTGVQIGAINVAGSGEGFQVGLINRCETLHGYQLGVLNVIRDGNIKLMPILNIGF